MAVKQTAGRDALGEFAPKFAELNDEVLFGQVWSREDKLSLRDSRLVTVVALLAEGLTDSIAERDRKDSSRATAPLAQAPDALLVDTSDMTIDQVVRFITDNIQQKLSSR